jgi:hypothetical protein
MREEREPGNHRWWQFSVRSLLVLSTIFPAYLVLLFWICSLFGARSLVLSGMPMACESVLVFVLCLTALMFAREARVAEVNANWRRGCYKVFLAFMACAILSLPLLWFVFLWVLSLGD